MSFLTSLDISANNLSGPIPSHLVGILTSLEHLQAQKYGLTGRIPSELSRLTKLTSMHLFPNDFTGQSLSGHVKFESPSQHFKLQGS